MNQTKLPGGDTAFNGNRTITRAGIPNLNVGGATLGAFLNNYFFPAVGPSCNVSASNPVRLFGAPTAVRLYFNVAQGTNPVVGIILAGQTIDNDYLNGYLDTATQPNASTSYTLFVTDGDLDTTAQASVTYQHQRFWFQSGENLLTYSDADLSDFMVNVQSKEFATNRRQERQFSLNGEYSYFAYPASFGPAAFLVGGLPNTAYVLREFPYTNAFGYTEPYYLYRSGAKNTGTLSVQVQ